MKILVIQRRLTILRKPFFEKLREDLKVEGIELYLVYGSGTERELLKNDTYECDWAIKVPTYYLFKSRFCFIPVKQVNKVDVVITTHEISILSNYFLFWRKNKFKLVFWGHGDNFQRKSSLVQRAVRKWSLKFADHYFAYNDASATKVLKNGYSTDKLTILYNSVDTELFNESLRASRRLDRHQILTDFCLQEGRFGIFVGSIYHEKMLDFLIEATFLIREAIPDFQLLIVGDGPQKLELQKKYIDQKYIHFLGYHGTENKSKLLSLSEVILNPGLIGLGVFDGLVSGLPTVSCNNGLHSPEVEYLKGECGVFTHPTSYKYAKKVISVMQDESLKKRVRKLGPQIAKNYSISNMSKNFVQGVLTTLDKKL